VTNWLLVSATSEEAQRLASGGPRRDFIELARAAGGELLYRHNARSRRGLRGRLFGPHLVQAWRAAALARSGDTIFADGEHIGLPLLAALRVRRRRPARVVMLGHLPGRRWKLALFRLLTRGALPGVVVVHSVAQAQLLAPALARGWRVELLPYQVDADYWRADAAPAPGEPRILAVGSEHRDYDTLVRAVQGLPARVVIAAGSHWARAVARTSALPSNVEYYDRPLPFAQLREEYVRATIVVVPLHPVANQSGVTTMLEAMSMHRPLVVTASPGQRECVRGSLVRADGSHDDAATADRGPALLGRGGGATEPTGLYVAPGDAPALRVALDQLLADAALRERLAAAARDSAAKDFGLDAFVAALAALLAGAPLPAPSRPR
jgi:glycosyltransferase involved in cell wall biosynthesis